MERGFPGGTLVVQTGHVGFEIGDEFVVGYGLDLMEKYRNLPFVGVLKATAQRGTELFR